MFFLSLALWFQTSVMDVVWDNTYIEIPLYEEVSAYTLMPEASLVINHQKIETEAIYERGVDRTFLSVLTSVERKTFYIKYRVHFFDYQLSHTQVITFEIVDITPPEIIQLRPIEIAFGSDLDVFDYIHLKDDYDPFEKLSYFIELSHIQWSHVGSYPIQITVSDQSMNTSILETSVTIYDRQSPTINQKKPIVLNPFESFHWQIYFEINDDVSSVIQVDVDDSLVLYDTLGEYPISLCAMDESNNTTCIQTTIVINDMIAPEVVLVQSTPEIHVHTKIDDALILSFIVRLKDNYTPQDYLTIQIDHEINSSVIGTYEIYFEISDTSNNVTFVEMTIFIKDLKPPEVYLLVDEIHVFDPLLPLQQMLDIRDNYDSETQISTKITSTINNEIVGTYTIEVRVEDTSKNKANYTFFVHVVDLEPPKLNFEDAVIISNFEKIDYQAYFHITDNYDTTDLLQVMYDDTSVNYLQPGMYLMTITIIDQSGNELVAVVDVLVVDILPPKIELYEEESVFELHEQIPHLKDNIAYVDDNITPLFIDDVVILGYVDNTRVGTYIIEYMIDDEAGARTIVTWKVLIVDRIAPIVTCLPLVTKKDQAINFYEGLLIEDASETFITLVSTSHISNDIGTYELLYSVIDASGNETLVTRTLIIEGTIIDTLKGYKTSLIFMSIGIITSIVIHSVMKRYSFDKKVNFKYNDSNEA